LASPTQGEGEEEKGRRVEEQDPCNASPLPASNSRQGKEKHKLLKSLY